MDFPQSIISFLYMLYVHSGALARLPILSPGIPGPDNSRTTPEIGRRFQYICLPICRSIIIFFRLQYEVPSELVLWPASLLPQLEQMPDREPIHQRTA